MRVIAVTARWDAESCTWWSDGEEVPGRCCEGRRFEELSDGIPANLKNPLKDMGKE